MPSLQEKIASILSESAVPGTDAILGSKQAETLKDAASQESGADKTSKMTKGYDKSTSQEKLDAPAQSGETDSKASDETSKIKAAYKSETQDKLKEDAFEALFSGETLSEDFKIKAEAIFESAVEQVVEARIEALQEEYQVQLDEAVEEVKGELVEQIDGYLDYLVQEWMQDNAVALESGIKVEMAESLIESLKVVFEQHNIEIPEAKIALVDEQAEKISEMEAELEVMREATELAAKEVTVLQCEAIITKAQEGLTSIEAEKLTGLAENVEFDSTEEFAAKVDALRESYFRKTKTVDEATTQVNTVEISENKSHSDVQAVLNVLRNPDAFKVIRSSN